MKYVLLGVLLAYAAANLPAALNWVYRIHRAPHGLGLEPGQVILPTTP